MKASPLYTVMAHGIQIHWFDVGGVVYGLNSRSGITDQNGWPVEHIDAGVAYSIMSQKAGLDEAWKGPVSGGLIKAIDARMAEAGPVKSARFLCD